MANTDMYASIKARVTEKYAVLLTLGRSTVCHSKRIGRQQSAGKCSTDIYMTTLNFKLVPTEISPYLGGTSVHNDTPASLHESRLLGSRQTHFTN